MTLNLGRHILFHHYNLLMYKMLIIVVKLFDKYDKEYIKLDIKMKRNDGVIKYWCNLRIDNSRQSITHASLHCSLSVIHTISYHIPNIFSSL